MHRAFGLTRILPYYEIGGKYLYSEKDVDNLLMSNYRNVIYNP